MKKFLTFLLSVLCCYLAFQTDFAIAKNASKKHHEVIENISSININTADKSLLKKIKGIGDKRAEEIIDYRKEHGNFTSVDDLNKVKGLGGKRLSKILDKNDKLHIVTKNSDG